MEASEGFKFCRVCLVPEEVTGEFKSIFDDNGKLALKIYALAGVLMLEVDDKVPSLACQKCIIDIEAVEKLKMRILDADEYHSMMTMDQEKRFLEVDMKNLIAEQNKTLRSKRSRRSSPIRRNSIHIDPDFMNVKIKQEPIDDNYENVNPKKRKVEPVKAFQEPKEVFQKPKVTPKAAASRKFLPKATPKQLGIHRMVIKSKLNKSTSSINKSSEKAPLGLARARKIFTPKLNLSRLSRGKSHRSSNGEAKRITFECDNCKETFESYQALNDHLKVHDFVQPFICSFCNSTFATGDYLNSHIRTRHQDDSETNVTV